MRGSRERTTERARRLRQSDNDAEGLLWSELRARRLNGYKFVRQLSVGRYFADFACREARLVIEVDGSQHVGSDWDTVRDDYMVAHGWSVVRFWNGSVLTERQSVLETIVAILDGRLQENVVANDMRFLMGRKEIDD